MNHSVGVDVFSPEQWVLRELAGISHRLFRSLEISQYNSILLQAVPRFLKDTAFQIRLS
jgi:hypothetical protein